MGKEIVTEMLEDQIAPYRINPKRNNTKTHINETNKYYSQRKKKLKSAREKKQITYKGIPIRLTADL